MELSRRLVGDGGSEEFMGIGGGRGENRGFVGRNKTINVCLSSSTHSGRERYSLFINIPSFHCF